ncbi:tetratricopeptide repeat protein [Fulvivirga sp. RKSG066]|uniref:tetratricopeptide repeat protein n=1 Tax=Fulvivirga aurantia TaxID=2529383 RepID=UPI0012BD0089|nr:tetratricopeptide repeat protein [Fulvivirga aurantia]
MRIINITIFSVLLSLASSIGFCQDRESDSLVQLKDATRDINQKIKTLNKLTKDYIEASVDTSLVLSDSAIRFAKKHHLMKGLIEARKLQDQAVLKANNSNKAGTIMNQFISLAKKNKNKHLQATGLYFKSRILFDNGFIVESQLALENAISLRTAINDQYGLANALNLKGNIHTDLGHYSEAIEAYQKALLIDIALDDQVGLSDRYNNIARIYSAKDEFEKSLEFFRKSFDISEKLNDKPGMATLANNIGFVLKQQGKYDEALPYLFRAIKIEREIKEVCGDIYPLYNIGSIYQRSNQLDSAFYYLSLVADKAETCADQYVNSLVQLDLGLVMEKRNDVQQAEKLLKSAFDNATTYGLTSEAKDAALALSDLYQKNDRPSESLKFFRIYFQLHDSIFNQQNTARIARLEAEYEFAQQKKQDSLKHKLEEVEKAKELANVIWVRNSLIIGCILLAIATALILINYNRKNKANAQLNLLNKKINRQKEELEQQADKLTNANEEIIRINENLEQIVQDRTKVITEQNKKILEYVAYNSHQVRGPLARILGLVSLFQKKGIKTEEVQEKLGEIKKEASELDKMVRKMNRTLEKSKKTIKDQEK